VFPFPETVPNLVCHFKGSFHKIITRPTGTCCHEVELRLRMTISSNSITGYEAITLTATSQDGMETTIATSTSNKPITWQQPARQAGEKEPSEPTSFDGDCSSHKSIPSRVDEALGYAR
jgi:hypothetical protein